MAIKIIKNSRKPDITFYNSGRIEISSRIARLLNLSVGDIINIVIVNGEPCITIALRKNDVIGTHEGRCLRTNKTGKHLRVYSKTIRNFIFEKWNGASCVSLPVGTPFKTQEYGVLLPLIINNNLHHG